MTQEVGMRGLMLRIGHTINGALLVLTGFGLWWHNVDMIGALVMGWLISLIVTIAAELDL